MTVSIAAPTLHLSAHTVAPPAVLSLPGPDNSAANLDSGAQMPGIAAFAATLLAQHRPAPTNPAPGAPPAITPTPAATPGTILPVSTMMLSASPARGATAAGRAIPPPREKTGKTADKSAVFASPAQAVPDQALVVQPVFGQGGNVQAATEHVTPQEAGTRGVAPAAAARAPSVSVRAPVVGTTPVARPEPATAPLPDADDARAQQSWAAQTSVPPIATPVPVSVATDAVIASALAEALVGQDASSATTPTAVTPARIAARIAETAARVAAPTDPLSDAASSLTAVVAPAATIAPTMATAAPVHLAAAPTNASPPGQHAAAKTAEPAIPATTLPYIAATPAMAATPEPIAPTTIAPVHGPTDFATLVDTIARARDDNALTGAAPVGVTMQHADFGPVSMQFTAHGQGLAVTMRSADPGFAPAAAAAATSASTGAGNGQSDTGRSQNHGAPDPSAATAAPAGTTSHTATTPDQAARQSAGQNATLHSGLADSQSGQQPRSQPHAQPGQTNTGQTNSGQTDSGTSQQPGDVADTSAIFA